MKRGEIACPFPPIPRSSGDLAALTFLLSVAALSAGCSTAPMRGGSFLPPVVRASFSSLVGAVSRGGEGTDGGSLSKARFRPGRTGDPTPGPGELVERSLRARGVRFGSDGSPGALFAFVRYSHKVVSPSAAKPGDLVFFRLGDKGCGDHVGLVEAIDPQGRITFKESRAGEIRRSFVHPGAPSLRRDESGRVLNTFLRPKRRDDPPAARYFAGEMLCAVGRVDRSR
jgi:hypothetical protein